MKRIIIICSILILIQIGLGIFYRTKLVTHILYKSSIEPAFAVSDCIKHKPTIIPPIKDVQITYQRTLEYVQVKVILIDGKNLKYFCAWDTRADSELEKQIL